MRKWLVRHPKQQIPVQPDAYMITKEQKLVGDSLYYDRALNFGKAYKNVMLQDTVQNMVVYGEYGEFERGAGHAFITDSAMAVLVDKQDSLFLHSDTLFIHFDQDDQVEYMKGFYKTKFYRHDMQGKCDSMIYSFTDSTIFLYHDPVIWSTENQLTADSIRIAMANNRVDTLALLGNAFIISMDDTCPQYLQPDQRKSHGGLFQEQPAFQNYGEWKCRNRVLHSRRQWGFIRN
ncbi:MAG: hypothetical protein R2759_12475 [Bacteroidales bacterium]